MIKFSNSSFSLFSSCCFVCRLPVVYSYFKRVDRPTNYYIIVWLAEL